MADIGVKIEASGFETIEKEAKLILNAKVGEEISNAVYADMKDALEEHIRDDVYSHAIYEPKTYLRRSEHRGMGVSLRKAVTKKEYTQQIGPFDYATMEWVAGLSYEPTGKHENLDWYGVDGDLLIGRIEKKEPPYQYEPRKGKGIPERPFWQNFIEELIEGGRLERTVEAELKRRGIAEPGDHITGVIRDDADGNY
jgi:hypothetical protein